MHPGRSGFQVLLLVCLLSGMAVAQGSRMRPPDAGTAGEPARPSVQWFLRGRTAATGTAAEHLQHAYEQKLRVRADRAARLAAARTAVVQPGSGIAFQQTSVGNTSAVWMPLGPRPTATASSSDLNQDYGPAVGRVAAVVVDPNDSSGNTVYVGEPMEGCGGRATPPTPRQACVRQIPMRPALPMCSGSRCWMTSPHWLWEPLRSIRRTRTGFSSVRERRTTRRTLTTGWDSCCPKDGGASWTLKDSTVDGEPLHGLGITRIAFSLDNPNTVVATAAVASTAVRLGAETGGAAARGIYYSQTLEIPGARQSCRTPEEAR